MSTPTVWKDAAVVLLQILKVVAYDVRRDFAFAARLSGEHPAHVARTAANSSRRITDAALSHRLSDHRHRRSLFIGS